MYGKLKCYLGIHSWAYHSISKPRGGYKEWKVCKRCKIEFFTTDYYAIWHKLFPGMMFYRNPEDIIKKGN